MMGELLAVFFCMVLGAFIAHVIRGEFLIHRAHKFMDRAEPVLQLIERHGHATDATAARVVDEVREVKREARQATKAALQARDVAAITPERAAAKVAEKVVEKLKSSESGPDWKPGDADRRSPGN